MSKHAKVWRLCSSAVPISKLPVLGPPNSIASQQLTETKESFCWEFSYLGSQANPVYCHHHGQFILLEILNDFGHCSSWFSLILNIPLYCVAYLLPLLRKLWYQFIKTWTNTLSPNTFMYVLAAWCSLYLLFSWWVTIKYCSRQSNGYCTFQTIS